MANRSIRPDAVARQEGIGTSNAQRRDGTGTLVNTDAGDRVYLGSLHLEGGAASIVRVENHDGSTIYFSFNVTATAEGVTHELDFLAPDGARVNVVTAGNASLSYYQGN